VKGWEVKGLGKGREGRGKKGREEQRGEKRGKGRDVDLAGLLGGRMASAEGGSVPSEVGYGEGVPSPAD